MSAASNYLENKLIDAIFRGQTFPTLSTLYVGLCTAAPSDSSFGTEVSTSGTNYARVAVTSSLANWAGTQSAGSTTASSGTSGTTSNNNAIDFPTPSISWGTVTHWIIADAATNGNLLFYGSLSSSKTVNPGDDVGFIAGSLELIVA